MSTTALLLFIATAGVIIVTPGPTVLLALSNGARYGLRYALYGMLGAMLSDLILVSAVALGLGAVLAASEVAFATLKWIGVVYLLYLGIKLLRAPLPSSEEAASSANTPQPARIFLNCLLVALTNPKGYLFVSAILPQFISTQSPQLPQYVLLASTFALTDGLIMLLYAAGGARVVRHFRTPKTVLWINRLSGGALVTLAGALAFYRRAQR